MSIKVIVNGSPVCMRRRKVLLTDPEVWKRNEFNRRRRIRIEQVRQQSKDVASRLRKQFRKERDKQLSEFEQEQIAELKRQHARRLLNLQQKYQDCVGEVGKGHIRAFVEPDPAEVLAEQRRRNAMLAQQRGREAQEQERKENLAVEQERERIAELHHHNRVVEDLRSTMISSLAKQSQKSAKKKTPLRTISNISGRSKHETRVKTGFPFKSPKKGNNKTSRKIPSLTGIHSTDEDESESDSEIQLAVPDTTARTVTSTRIEEPSGSGTSVVNVQEQASEESHQNKVGPVVTELTTAPETVPKIALNPVRKKVFKTVPQTVLDDVVHDSEPPRNTPVPKVRSPKATKKVPVQFYDHSARFHREYTPRPVVQRISPGKQIEKESSVDFEELATRAAQMAASEVERAALRERRGHQAIAKERAKRDYKQLLGDLDALTREERRLRGAHVPGGACAAASAFMTDERRHEHLRERQRRMDSAFEGVMHSAQWAAELERRSPSVDFAESTTTTTTTCHWEPSPATLNVGRLPASCPCPPPHRRSPSPRPTTPTPTSTPDTTSTSTGSIVVGRLPPAAHLPARTRDDADSLERLMERVNAQRRLLLEEVSVGGTRDLPARLRELPAMKRHAEWDVSFSSSSSSEAGATMNGSSGRDGKVRGQPAPGMMSQDERDMVRLGGNVHETVVRETWLPPTAAGEGKEGRSSRGRKEKRWRRTDSDGVMSRTIVSEYSMSKTEVSNNSNTTTNNNNNNSIAADGSSCSTSYQGVKVIVSVTEEKKIMDVVTDVRTRRRSGGSPEKRRDRGKRREEKSSKKGKEKGGEDYAERQRERGNETRGEASDSRERSALETDDSWESWKRSKEETEGGALDRKRETEVSGKGIEESEEDLWVDTLEEASKESIPTRMQETGTSIGKSTATRAGTTFQSDSLSSTYDAVGRDGRQQRRDRNPPLVAARGAAADTSSTTYDSPPADVAPEQTEAVGKLLQTITRQQRRLDEWKKTVVLPPTKTLEDYVDILLAMPQEAVDDLTDVSSIPSPPSSIFDTSRNHPPEDPLDDMLQARITQIAREISQLDERRGTTNEAGAVLGQMMQQVRERSRTREVTRHIPSDLQDASASPVRGKRELAVQTEEDRDTDFVGGSTKVRTAHARSSKSCLPLRRSKSKDKDRRGKDRYQVVQPPKETDQDGPTKVDSYLEFQPMKTSSREQHAQVLSAQALNARASKAQPMHAQMPSAQASNARASNVQALNAQQCADQAMLCAERITVLNRQLELIRQENKRFLEGAHPGVLRETDDSAKDSTSINSSAGHDTHKSGTSQASRNTFESTRYESPPCSVNAPREAAPPSTAYPSGRASPHQATGERGSLQTTSPPATEWSQSTAADKVAPVASWQREQSWVLERDPRRLSTIVEVDSLQTSRGAVNRYLVQDSSMRSYVSSHGPLDQAMASREPLDQSLASSGVSEGPLFPLEGVHQGAPLSPSGVSQGPLFTKGGMQQGVPRSPSAVTQGPLSDSGRRSPDPLPDVMDEMLRRGLITSPLPWIRAEGRGASDFGQDDTRLSRDYYSSVLVDVPTGRDSPPHLHPPPLPSSAVAQGWQESSATSSNGGVDSTAEDLEGVFTKLGYGWASATLRKTRASKDLSSSSSPETEANVRSRRTTGLAAARRSGSGQRATPTQHSTPTQREMRLSPNTQREVGRSSPTQQSTTARRSSPTHHSMLTQRSPPTQHSTMTQRSSPAQRSTPSQHSTATQRASAQRATTSGLNRSPPPSSRGHSTPVKESRERSADGSGQVSSIAFPTISDLSTVSPNGTNHSSEDRSLTAPDVALRIPKRSPDKRM